MKDLKIEDVTEVLTSLGFDDNENNRTAFLLGFQMALKQIGEELKSVKGLIKTD